MFNLESFRFWFNVVVGNMGIYLFLGVSDDGFGTIRNKRQRGGAVFVAFFAVFTIFLFRIFPREMDIPGILSVNHKEMEGIVCDYEEEREREQGYADLIGGFADVKDNATGKIYRFRDTRIPSDLCIGDSVKMFYLKHYKMAAFVEINGKSYTYHIDNNKPVGIIMIMVLLISVPVYYFWVFKVKPFFDFKKDYVIYAYQDIFIKAMKVFYLFMLQAAAVLIIALLGYYKTSWDWYWGFLLIVIYVGIICLSFLRQKQFVIIRDKFYYCNFKKRVEGNLNEMKSVEKTEKGVLINVRDREMEILCTSDRYRDSFIKELSLKKGGNN